MTDYIKREDVLRLLNQFRFGELDTDIRGVIASIKTLPDASPQGPVSEPDNWKARFNPIQQALWDKYHIESDESFTECIERTIDGWKQRATKAEQECAEWKRRFDALLERTPAQNPPPRSANGLEGHD